MATAQEESDISVWGAGSEDGEKGRMGEMVRRQRQEGYWWWIGYK